MIVDCAAYVGGRRVEVDSAASAIRTWASMPHLHGDNGDLPEFDNGGGSGGFLWLGLQQPSEAELAATCKTLRFADVSPEEVLTPHSRPVLSLGAHTLQLVLRTARYDDDNEDISLGEMTLLVGPRAVVSIRHGPASPLAPVRLELESDPARLQLGPIAVVSAVVERVIEDYGPALDGLENDAVEVERDVFSPDDSQPVQRLYALKRQVRRMLVAIDALQDPLGRLIRGHGQHFPAEVVADLHEAADQLDREVTRATSLSNLLDAALAASLTQISVRQNDDMRKISAWVAMAAVPTMIAGIYGMNFESMPELGSRYGYPIVLGLMAITVAVLYRMFKRSGWL